VSCVEHRVVFSTARVLLFIDSCDGSAVGNDSPFVVVHGQFFSVSPFPLRRRRLSVFLKLAAGVGFPLSLSNTFPMAVQHEAFLYTLLPTFIGVFLLIAIPKHLLEFLFSTFPPPWSRPTPANATSVFAPFFTLVSHSHLTRPSSPPNLSAQCFSSAVLDHSVLSVSLGIFRVLCFFDAVSSTSLTRLIFVSSALSVAFLGMKSLLFPF